MSYSQMDRIQDDIDTENLFCKALKERGSFDFLRRGGCCAEFPLGLS